MPFEVPESWCWVSLSDVCNVARGGSPRPIKEYLTDDKNGINWIKIGDADKDGKYINSTKEKISPSGISKSRMVHKGDFLLTNSMSFGRPYILNIDGCIHDGWLVISPIPKTYDPEFLYYLLSSGFAYSQFTEAASGGVVSNLNSDKVGNSLFPLPPQSEQKRIVSELEKLFEAIRLIDNNKLLIRHNIEQIRSKILELAIYGKLVHQNTSDEPAIELLKRINPAYKPADNRHYENKPFLIPDSWLWVMGKDLFLPMKNCKPSGDYFKYIDIDSIDNQDCVIKCPKVLPVTAAPSRATRYTQVGDILFSMVRPYLKNIAIVTEGNCIASTGFYVCSPNEALFSKYCYYLMISPYVINGLTQFMKGDNSPSINNAHISEWLYPLPPLNEQKRIVQKIDEIFNYLDSIVAEL